MRGRTKRPRERLSALGAGSIAQRLLLRTLDFAVMPVWAFARDQLITVIERRNGITTAGIRTPAELGLAAPGRSPYSPAPWSALRRALPIEWVRPDDAFADLGSGMGRVVFQAAAHYPFRRVIGVDLAEELHRAALVNIGHNRARLTCQDIQLVRSDVLDYVIPDDVTVVFLFNPFTGQIFSQVMDRLVASPDHNPRRLRLVYLCPVEHDQIMATGRARLIKQVRRPRPIKSWADRACINVYDLQPRPTPLSRQAGSRPKRSSSVPRQRLPPTSEKT